MNSSNAVLYSQLKRHVLSEFDRRRYGYPMEANPGRYDGKVTIVHDFRDIINDFLTNRRVCRRCFQKFDVDIDGYPTKVEECRYHRQPMVIGGTHTCCYSLSPCEIAPSHTVRNAGHPDETSGFIRLAPPKISTNNHQVFAIDCEMVSTTIGFELARLTIVDIGGNIVLDEFVKPRHRILDHNTPYSGITGQVIDNAKWTLDDVHKYLRKTMTTETIICGHGLEHDLKVIKLVHDKVVDTTQLFPHHLGFPRSSLKWLAQNHLSKNIQSKFSNSLFTIFLNDKFF